jgi:formiminotetrahydrofolate cyclodeaminase
MYAMLARAEELRTQLTVMIERDAKAFEAVMDAMKLPRDTDEEAALRLQAMEAATLKAAEVPLETARMAAEVIDLAEQAVTLGNLNAISDGASAAALARAALTGAGYNVRINISSLAEPQKGAALLDEVRRIEAHAVEVEARIREQLVSRGGMPQV